MENLARRGNQRQAGRSGPTSKAPAQRGKILEQEKPLPDYPNRNREIEAQAMPLFAGVEP